jgi:small subunit ribosomal protein S16
VLEELGHYDPELKDEQQQVRLNEERIKYWLSVGAIPSPTVSQLLKKHGIAVR